MSCGPRLPFSSCNSITPRRHWIRISSRHDDASSALERIRRYRPLHCKSRGAEDSSQQAKRKIANVVQEIAGLYQLQATARGRRLCVDLSTDLEADLDEKIFGLILHNLLSNAISHGCGEIRVRLRHRNGAARLFVLNRVPNQANAGVGTGLGLRTVAILAEAHNLAFRSRRIFNGYAVVVRIRQLP